MIRHYQQYTFESSSRDDKVLILELEFTADDRGVFNTSIDNVTVDSVLGQYTLDYEEYRDEYDMLRAHVDNLFKGRAIESIQQDDNSCVDNLLMKRLRLD